MKKLTYSRREILDAIADAEKNDYRWTALDEMVQAVAEDAAGKQLDNVYEYSFFDDDWRAGLTSNDPKTVKKTLSEIWDAFHDNYLLSD